MPFLWYVNPCTDTSTALHFSDDVDGKHLLKASDDWVNSRIMCRRIDVLVLPPSYYQSMAASFTLPTETTESPSESAMNSMNSMELVSAPIN